MLFSKLYYLLLHHQKQKIIINTNKNDYESFYFNTYLFPAFGTFDN